VEDDLAKATLTLFLDEREG